MHNQTADDFPIRLAHFGIIQLRQALLHEQYILALQVRTLQQKRAVKRRGGGCECWCWRV
jgi:hypothetical protein